MEIVDGTEKGRIMGWIWDVIFSGSVGGLRRRKWYEITFHVVKAMGFECMNECESMHVVSWTVKKAERRRIDAFEMWCWRRLESSLDCKEIKPASPRGNQSWIFIGRTDTEAETPILWPPDAKSWLMEKTLTLGKIEGRRRRGQQRTRLNGINDSMDVSLRKLQEMVKDREAWHAAVHGVAQNRTQLSD